ncbi:thioredoxin family protein [Kitasatospora sp. NPDC001132]
MTYGVVLFGAEWCAPCKSTKPHVVAICDELGLALDYVDVEYGDDRSVGITAVPTIRVYDEFAEVVREHRGGMNAAQVRAFLGGLD